MSVEITVGNVTVRGPIVAKYEPLFESTRQSSNGQLFGSVYKKDLVQNEKKLDENLAQLELEKEDKWQSELKDELTEISSSYICQITIN